MTGKKRVKKISTIAVAGAMSVNALMPYSFMQVEAAENTQDNSFTGGTADRLLQDQLAKALKNSNKTADQVVQATYGSFSALSSGANVTTRAGKYKVASGVQRIINWNVTGNVVVYLPKGSILYVEASTVYNEQAGNHALTIASGAHLTIVGEGYLAIKGGTGGAGNSRFGQATGSGAVKGETGGTGKVGGYAISNSGTFEVSTLFAGSASIIGGTGGDGGKGQDVAPNNVLSTAGFTGGTGGIAGNGAAAIYNNGNIIINGDSVNKNLSTTGAYGQGNVNIKGGIGGHGGEGGTAHGATVTWTREGTEKQAEYPGNLLKGWIEGGVREDKPNKEDGYKLYWHSAPTESKDVATLYPAKAGAAGATGAAGVGIAGGTITMNGGFASVEGGNGNVSYAAGNNNGAPGYIAGTSLEGKSATWGLQTIEDFSKNPAFDDTQPESDTNVKFIFTSNIEKDNKVSEKGSFNVACVYGNGTTSKPGNVALYGVNVVRNGGTLQAYAGTSSSVAISGGTQTGFGGTFFAGASSSDGYSGNQASAATFQLAQLEGTGTAADGTQINVTDAKNFYILNAGDTYYDANGKLQTAQGIKVNGKPYGGKDIFVNPQGYVYLSGVKTSDTVVMQVAIGGKRIGDAGSSSKYVTSDAGIYTFTGSNGKLEATFASDTSSMDMEWLAKQMANDFSGNQVEIDTPYKLAAFAYAVNHGVDGAANAHIKLTSNIDLKAMYWTPIGTKSHPFIGVFDGNGKTIKNMRIQTISSVDAYGLFGHVKGIQDGKNITSVIKNFTLTNGAYVTNPAAKTIKVNGADGGTASGAGYTEYATYKVEQAGDIYAGAIVGHAENTAFSNINVQNLPMTVKSTNGDVHLGGLVGYDGILADAQAQNIKNTNVINSGLSATAKNNAYVGGVVGESADVDFINVFNDLQNVGSIGKQTSANMVVRAENKTYAGGIVGKAYSTIEGMNREITNVGFKESVKLKSRVINAAGTDETYVGGIVGDATDMELRTVYATMKQINASSSKKDAYVGGIVGRSEIDKTTYRSITNSSVALTGGSNNISAIAIGNAYMGGVAGYSNHTDSMSAKVTGMAPLEVKANTGKAYAGGNVGYAKEAIIGNGAITITQDIKATGNRGAWASGSLGYGVEASITSQKISMKGIYADSTTGSPAYAGGVVGQISNKSAENKINAVLSNSTVLFTASGNIQASSAGLSQPAFAGGIVGDAVNVNVYGNKVNEGTTAMISVNAFSEDSTSYAGGMAGRIDNSATSQKISISDTILNNMSIKATNKAGKQTGKEAYGGGIAGKAIADEVVVMNTIVKGTSNVTVNASFDAYAGRLFGHTVRATILNSAPSAGSTISATSVAGDAYAAGLIGRLDEKIGKANESAYQSTISMSGVSKTNVTANAGSSKTAYAGSLLGDAQNVLIQKSSVNQGINTSGTLSNVTVKGKDAYVGGIAGRIVNPEGKKLSYNSVSATSVKTNSTAATETVKQAGMYGQINNVFIASSFAKNYRNEHNNDTGSLHGGLFADANDIRMIQSYGSHGNSGQTGIDTTGTDAGLAAKLTGENQFYGIYSTETKWAYDGSGNAIDATHQGDGNTFKSSYYSGSGEPVTAGSVWGSTATWGATNYTKNGDLFELKDKDKSGKYYDSLSAVSFGNDTQKNNVSNAMRNLLHFTASTNDDAALNDISTNQDLTTSYEKEVDYRLSYVSKQGDTVAGNFNYPTFDEPYFLTLAVLPGDEYGEVSESSSISKPGSKKFGANTKLQFTAVPKDVPEESSFWYEFNNWTIQKRTVDGEGNVKLENVNSVSGTDLAFDMPKYDTVVTANFVQKDNSIRRNINKEIHERTVAEIERRSNLSKNDPNYMNPNKIDKNDLKNIYTEIGTDVLGKYVGTTGDSYRANMESTYDKIAGEPDDAYSTYDSLKDPDRVLQQIAANMAEESFASNEYKFVMEDGALSLDELNDVRVDVNDTFTSKGDFKDYVTKQSLVETKVDKVPAITSTQATEDGHLQGVINRPFKGEGTTLEYSFKDPTKGEGTWTSAGDGDLGYVILDSKEANGADAVYLRNVDKDGFEVITRVPLSKVTTEIKNEKINSDTKNTDVGAVGVNDSGLMESIRVDGAEILKSSSNIEIAGGDKDKGDWYYGTSSTSSANQQTLIHGVPKQGAYLDSFTIEVNGKTLEINENTKLSTDGKLTFEGVTFTLSGDRFKNKDYTSEEALSFPADATVKVTSNYVNLLGEINASSDAASENRAKEQISSVLEQAHFKDIFVDNTKNEPKNVSAAKERYDALNDSDKKLVQEKLALFLPKDALGNTAGYSRAEFIDVFNAITNIVYVESKLDVNNKGEITAIKKDDFTSGTWSNVTDALKQAESSLTGSFIVNDGSAKSEAERLLESSKLLEEAVEGLTYKVQTFTLSTNNEELVKVEADKGKNSPALLKSAALLSDISTDSYTNIIKFPYQHSDVVVTFSKQEMNDKGYSFQLTDTNGKKVLNADGSVADGIKNVSVKEEGGKLIVTFKDITESMVYKATVAKKQYTISIPKDDHIKTITNSFQRDEDGNLINLEGTSIQVEDMSESKEAVYVLQLEAEDGYRFNSNATDNTEKVSYTYMDKDGNKQTAYVVVDEKGNLEIPKEHLSTLDNLDVSNAVRGLDKTDLVNKVNESKNKYEEKDYTEASYKNWKDAYDKAAEVANNADATSEEINSAYKELNNAEDKLIRQYVITLNDGLMIPDGQDGVRKLDDGKYYVQEGYGVYVQTTADKTAELKKKNEKLDVVSYEMDDNGTSITGNATLKSDGYSAYLPSITAPVTSVSYTTSEQKINIVENGMKDDKGNDVTTSSVVGTQNKSYEETVYHASDVKASNIKDTPTAITTKVSGVDANGNASNISIEVSGLDASGTGLDSTTGKVTVTTSNGTTIDVPLDKLPVNQITSTPDSGSGDATVELKGEVLDAILEYLATEKPSQELYGDYTIDSVDVTSKAADGSETSKPIPSGDVTIGVDRNVTNTVSADAPSYVITPEDAYATTGVKVDGTEVNIPDDAKIGTITSSTGTNNPDGTTTFTSNEANGDVIKITVDSKDKNIIKGISVTPNGKDYDVIFNSDKTDEAAGTGNTHITDTKYGEAVVSWNKPNVDAHIVEGSFKKKEFDVTGATVTGGTITPDSSSVEYGKDAIITLNPETNKVIEPTKKITVEVNGTTISGTLEELAKRDELEVNINKDKDGAITSAVITAKDNHSEVIVSAEDDLFRSNQPSDILNDFIQPSIDKLKDKVAVADAIIGQKDESPYVVGDQQYKDMVHENDIAKDMLDKLTKDDGTLIDSIKNAKTEKEMLDAIKEALGEDTPVISIGDVQNKLNDSSESIQAAIENLNAKEESKRKEQIVVTLPDSVGVSKEASGIDSSVKPTVNVMDKNTPSNPLGDGSSIVTDGKQNFVIQPVQVLPGNDVTEITMKVKNPDTNEEKTVTIPLAPNAGNDKLSITITDDKGTTTSTIDFAGIYPILSKSEGTTSIKLPGDILDDIFKASFGKDVTAGMVEEIVISKTTAKSETKPNDTDNVTNDGGIKDATTPVLKTNETDVDGNTTTNSGADSNDKIDLASEGITVQNIDTKDDYALNGITVSVKDTAGKIHQVFVPSTDTNTKDTTTPGSTTGKDITVSNKDLVDAIKEQLKNPSLNPADFTVVDVTVNTTAPVTSKEASLNRSEEIKGLVLDTKDTSGNKVSITVPIDGNTSPDKVIVEYQKDGKTETVEVPLSTVKGNISTTINPDGKEVVNISGTMVEDILDQITKNPASSTVVEIDSKHSVTSKDELLKERVANELPEEITAGKGIQSKIDKDSSLTGSDTSGTGTTNNNHLLENDEHLVIDNIEPSDGYTFDGAELTIKGLDNSGKEVEKKVEVQVASDGSTKVLVDGKEITLSTGELKTTMPDGTGTTHGSLDFSKEALETIYKEIGLHDNAGIYEADITDITVTAKLTDTNAIAMPDVVDNKGSHNLDPNTKVEITVTPTIVLPDIKIADDMAPVIVKVPVEDVNGTKVVVKVDYTDPENPHAYVDAGSTTVEIAFPEEWKDSIKTNEGKITEIPGDVLQDIINSYNEIAKKDIDTTGAEITDTIPLEFPKLSVGSVTDDTDTDLSAEVTGGTYVEGALSGNEDITISPVKVKPAHQLEDVVVTTKDKNGNEITIKVPVAPNPDSTSNSVSVIVTDKDTGDSYEYHIPTDQLNDVSVVESDGKEITLPGSLVTDIIEKTVEQDHKERPASTLVKENEVTSVTVDAVRNGTHVPEVASVKTDGTKSSADVSVISRKDDKISDDAILLPETTDLLINNITSEEGFRPDQVVLTLKDNKGEDYKVQLPVPAKEGVINVTLPDGSTSTLPIKSDTHPDGIDLSALTLKEDTNDEIRVPGKAIADIMENLSGSNDMDITSVDINVSETSWKMPLSEDIVKNTNDSADPTTGVKEIQSVVLKSDGKAETSLITTDKKLTVDKNGSFTMLVAYGEDDYSKVNPSSHNFPHEYNGLKVNGISLSKTQLAGIVQVRVDGSLEIDTAKLTAKVADVSGEAFEGFNDIQIQTVPTNPQYKTFKSEYLGLDSMNSNSTEYEAMVEKLLSQFDTASANPDTLSADNMSHLINYKADLETRMEEIERQKKIDDLAQRIKNVYDAMDKAVDAVDGAKKGLPFVYGTGDSITGATINEVENYRGQVEALEKEYLALDNETRSDVANKVPGKSGEANKLDQMLDAIEEVDVQNLGKAGVVNKLLDKLLAETVADIVDDEQNPSTPDAYDVAKGKVQSLDDMTSQINKINTLISSMTADELKDVSSAKRTDLNNLEANVKEEYTDFANLFVKEYLTTDNKKYAAGSDGTSSNSTNGYTEATYKEKSNETKLAVMDAKKEFGKLSEEAKKAIGISSTDKQMGVFHGPTLNELFEKIVDPVNAVDVLIDEIDEHYGQLIDKATSQQEKDRLTQIRDEAIADLKDGQKAKSESFVGDSLNSIVKPTTDGFLGDIVYDGLERHVESLDTTISYNKADGTSETVDVHIAYGEDGSVSSISKDGVDITSTLTNEQLEGLKQNVAADPTTGSIHISGSVLEDVLGIKDATVATDKKIDKIDVTFAALTVDDLTKISDKAIQDMDAFVKDTAKQELQNEMQAIKDKIKDILGDEVYTLLDSQLETGKLLITNGDASDAHDLANAQIERMKDIVFSEIKKQLSEEFAKNAQGVSDEGYKKLQEAYENALESLKGSKDDLDNALNILVNAKLEMEKIHKDNPKGEEKPDVPKPEDKPENKPENKPGTNDPSKPQYPTNGGIQGVSRPGSTYPKYEIFYDQYGDTLQKKSDAATSLKELKKEYERIKSIYAGLKGMDGYDELSSRLKAIYDKAVKDLENATEDEREEILKKALKDMAAVEKEFKELKKDKKEATSSGEEEKNAKAEDASWFNLFSLIALLAGAIFAFMKRHRFYAILGIDLVAGIILLGVTQGLVLENIAFFNSYSIYFALLCVLDAVLLIGFRNKKKDDEEK